jgi:hypothetical protein
MNSFKSKYPTFVAIIAIVAAFARDLTAGTETLVEKLENSITLIPQVLAVIPSIGSLGTELAALKGNVADLEAGAELLVTDLAFSSVKAQAIIAAAFPFAEGIVALVPSGTALVAAIRS